MKLPRAADLLLGVEIISFHLAAYPTVRARANKAVNIEVGS